jgi:hypothetical protein
LFLNAKAKGKELPRFYYRLSVTNETTALLPRTSLIYPSPPTTNIIPRPFFLPTQRKAAFLFIIGAQSLPQTPLCSFFLIDDVTMHKWNKCHQSKKIELSGTP